MFRRHVEATQADRRTFSTQQVRSPLLTANHLISNPFHHWKRPKSNAARSCYNDARSFTVPRAFTGGLLTRQITCDEKDLISEIPFPLPSTSSSFDLAATVDETPDACPCGVHQRFARPDQRSADEALHRPFPLATDAA